ncbi:MAG: hypothetical protein R3B72_18405 [Polyangiaceae bacterium]
MKTMRMMGLLLVAMVAGAACADWTEIEDVECPPEGTDLTWYNFGQGFFAENCNSCHSVNAEDRKGAPRAYIFDTYDQVYLLRDRVFLRSAGDNATMPPGPDDPDAEARWMLAEWLACGAPQGDFRAEGDP